jgi:hypothetical protein
MTPLSRRLLRAAALPLLVAALSVGPLAQPAPDADGQCPRFEPLYAQCTVLEGEEFSINRFVVEAEGDQRLLLRAESNRGPITTLIVPDRVVRLGFDREDGGRFKTHQGSYCQAGRAYQQQVVYLEDRTYNVQNLEFWEDDGALLFQLDQNGEREALIRCTNPSR